MLKVFVVLAALVLFGGHQILAQSVKLNAHNQPLNEILIHIHENYNIQISYDHQLVSTCIVNDTTTYPSAEEAISNLVNTCNLNYDFSGGVFVIYKHSNIKKDSIQKPRYHVYSGQLIDAINNEPLPFSTIQINNNNFVADASGSFSFKTLNPTERMKVSYVGYYIEDTTISPGEYQKIKLTPSVVDMKEVIIQSDTIHYYNAHIGESPGLIKLNHKVATFLPGNNNNLLFNLLRLQPGILAAAEQSGDYSIWGSYRSQNLLQFDGIPLFSASSLNSEIGIVNPMMVNDIEVFKAGYHVDKSDRVGGIIQMSGNLGNTEKFRVHLNANSETVSGLMNIPIAKKFALQAAFRQSYYNIINWNEVFAPQPNVNESFTPDFTFQDVTLKFSGRSNNGDNFFISLLGNNDKSNANFVDERKKRDKALENKIEKQQLGAAAQYNKNWKRGGITHTSLSYSRLTNNSFDQINEAKDLQTRDFNTQTVYRKNSIEEMSVKVGHQFPMVGKHYISTGLGLINNANQLKQDTVEINDTDNKNEASYLSYYLKDNISLGKYLSFAPGIKLNYLMGPNDLYALPRVNASMAPHTNWRINLAWGMYNQYVSEIEMIDDLENHNYNWILSNNTNFPVVGSTHRVLGLSYQSNWINISTEGFYKTTKGLSRQLLNRDSRRMIIRDGKSRAYGIDIYAKKDIKNHDFWVSYTISHTEEDFSRNKDDYRKARHDQTHEIKAATILNFEPWHFSANYVYGSGMEFTTHNGTNDIHDYKRFDIALLYKFKSRKYDLEMGLSIVNVFNTKNISYQGFSNLPDGRRVYQRATPFTPSLFLNIGF